MSKVNYEVKKGNLHIGIDSNEDGQNAISIKLSLTEAIQEAIFRGTPLEGAKVVDFKFDLTRLILKIDTDRDGEALLELEIDLAEVFDEIKSSLIKKDSGPASAE